MPFAADTNDFHMNTLLSNDGEGVRSRILDTNAAIIIL